VNLRQLSIIAMVCAPAMLLEVVIPNGKDNNVVVGIASLIFMIGSLCSQIALWRLGASGRGIWGRIAQGFQIVLVCLAALFGVFEATAIFGDENPLFIITDIAWPLSMLWMLVLGITIAVRGGLTGWRRFIVAICGLALPSSIILAAVTGSDMTSTLIGIFFFGLLAVCWFLLGLAIYQTAAEPKSETGKLSATVSTAR
jgi:hypothetical protein